MSTRLLLIAGDDERRLRYADVLRRLDVTFDEIVDLAELETKTRSTAYSGILIDIATQTRCPAHYRDRMNHILDLFPVARLQWDTERNRVKALITIEHDTDDSFKFFTKSYCTTISPRTTRELERIRLNLNVLLSTTRQGCLDAPIKSLTLNISRQGCFICSCEEWQLNQEVWFVFKEMENHTPICGRICSLIPWGEALRFPGIGVLFAEIQDDQLLELDRWFP